MNKREQQRLYNAAKRLVKVIRYGGWRDPDTGNRHCMYSPADHEIDIDRRTKEIEKVLKEVKKQ